MTISESVTEQADQAFKNIERTLKESGSSLAEIVREACILPDKNDFQLCWPVLKKYLAQVKPAATMFQAELMDIKMNIEIQVTARLCT
jgi:enamine deaminase RidA (YjgF/YER057c/UK114 family)